MIERLLLNVPAGAAALGLAGVIPFAITAALSLRADATGVWAGFALLAYGAVILSVLGGIHWGLALARRAPPSLQELGIGVLPPLAGWVGLLAGGTAGLLLVMAGFLVVLAVDIGVGRDGGAPPWYARLRVALTCAICLCLLLAVVS